jgi:hypothetical protein
MQTASSYESFVSLYESVTLQKRVIFGSFPTVKDLTLRYEDKLVEVV